jgi:hypothetical protein
MLCVLPGTAAGDIWEVDGDSCIPLHQQLIAPSGLVPAAWSVHLQLQALLLVTYGRWMVTASSTSKDTREHPVCFTYCPCYAVCPPWQALLLATYGRWMVTRASRCINS